MAKGVLGNDPFQRGAAARPPLAERKDEEPAPASPPADPAVGQALQTAQPRPRPARTGKAKGKGNGRRGVPSATTESVRPSGDRAAMGEVLDRTLRSRVNVAAPVDQPTTAQVEPLLPGSYVPHPSSPDAVEIIPPSAEELPEAPAPSPRPPSESRAAFAGAETTRRPARELVRLGDVTGRAVLGNAPELGAVGFVRSLFGQALQGEGLQLARQVLGGSYHALLTGLGTGGSLTLDDYGKDAELTLRLSPLADLLFDRYWRVTVQGANLVPRGPAILVANHSGAIPVDGPVLHHALARARGDLAESRWLVEDQIFHAPFLGVLLNRLGAVRANPDNALRLLDEGRPVIVFPEGIQGIGKPFSERYQLKRFGRGGFVKLALRSGAPIVPVAIVGAEETSPLLGKLPGRFLGLPYLPLTSPIPLPARWAIRFGEPIDVRSATDDLADVQRLTERTREAIQGMLKTLLRERGPAFSGSGRGGPEVRA